MEGSTPREGRAAHNGWFWSRHRLSPLGQQVFHRLIKMDTKEVVAKELTLFEFQRVQDYLQWKLRNLVADIQDITGDEFDRDPDPAKCEDLDIVDRCVEALMTLQASPDLVHGFRHQCLMCNREREEVVHRHPASVGVRVIDTHSTCGYWTMNEVSLTPYRRDCDPPFFCAMHDKQFTRAFNAIIRIVPRSRGRRRADRRMGRRFS